MKRGLLACAFVLALAPCAAAAVAIDLVTVTSEQPASSSYSFNHTVTGSNLYLLVAIHHSSNSANITGITWNSTALSLVLAERDADSDNVAVEVWKLASPETGTHSVAVTFSASTDSFAVAASFTGVDSGTPLGTAVKDHYTGGSTAHTHDTTNQTNGLVWDAMSWQDGACACSINGGQTSQANVVTTDAAPLRGIDSTKAGAATVTTGYTWTNQFWRWAHITVPLNPVAAGGTTACQPVLGGGVFKCDE